ncbi:MAG: alpha/beta hydrolase-fold protein [Actinomycetes bacterium]
MPAPENSAGASFDTWVTHLEIANWTTVIIFIVLFVLIIAWCGRRMHKHKRWYFWPLPLAVVPLVLAGAAYANLHFGYYNRLGDLFDSYDFPTGPSALLMDPKGSHPEGVVVQTIIPSTSSGVPDRPAFIWLPPQYFTAPAGTKFPVVYAYHGVPGEFSNWFVSGSASKDAAAAAKAGLPAIVVAPSVSGSLLQDTECVNGVQGNWQDYLSKDVPNYIAKNAHALTGAKAQAVSGLSMGGYCALITALRNPDKFGFVGNFSGSTMPTHGGGMTALFGSSSDLNAQVDSYTSSWVIAHQPRSRKVSTWLSIGSSDEAGLIADQKNFTAAAKALGMNAVFTLGQGSHTFYVWSQDLNTWLPWALKQMERPHT